MAEHVTPEVARLGRRRLCAEPFLRTAHVRAEDHGTGRGREQRGELARGTQLLRLGEEVEEVRGVDEVDAPFEGHEACQRFR